MPRIKAVIADDERLSREHIQSQLALAWPELEIAGLAENGPKAMALIRELSPDLAFLDIKMPGLSGIEVAARIEGGCRVVFITAYDQYAVTAFEQEAVDYIIKPLTLERLAKTVDRIKRQIGAGNPGTGAARVYEQILKKIAGTGPPKYLTWIRAQVRGAVRLIPVDQVCYFQSSQKYTLVITKDREIPIRKTISQLAKELDPDMFFQVHRATIVNAACIDTISSSPTARGQLRLKGRPEIITVSRRFTPIFKQM